MRRMEAATTAAAGAQTNGHVLQSLNPGTGDPIGSVPTVTPDQVQSIVDDVAGVQPFWAQLPLEERARYMKRAAQVIIDRLDDLSALLAREEA